MPPPNKKNKTSHLFKLLNDVGPPPSRKKVRVDDNPEFLLLLSDPGLQPTAHRLQSNRGPKNMYRKVQTTVKFLINKNNLRVAETGPEESDPSLISKSRLERSQMRWKMRKESQVLAPGEEVHVTEAALRVGVGGIGCHERSAATWLVVPLLGCFTFCDVIETLPAGRVNTRDTYKVKSTTVNWCD